jgi:hypothetical protein
MGIDAAVECGVRQKIAAQIVPSALVCCVMNLPHPRLPFSRFCMANCIMETSQCFEVKVLVYSLAL